MKNILLLTLCALFSITMFSQKEAGFGLTGGLNYSANGDYFESASNAAENPDRNIGYHIGIYAKVGERVYFRPELLYTQTKSDYDGDKFNMSKIDAPFLVGAKIIGPLHIFAGPAFQYIVDTDFDGITINDVENDFSVGLHVGAGVNLGRLGIDVRYERGLSSNEASFINTNITALEASRIDVRPDQIILNLSVKL